MAWKRKRQVMYRYDVTAEIYETRYCAEQRRKYQKTLEVLDPTGLVVLDAGCGSGMFFSQVAGKVEIIVGVDISRKLLKKAKAQGKLLGNVMVVRADADHLPFRSGIFGAAFGFTMLQNMPKPTQTLHEIKGAVADDGKIVVTGLKKAFPLEKFMDILDSSVLPLVAFIDDAAVNCYIGVLST